MARNTTEIEYVLVPRTQLDCNDVDLLHRVKLRHCPVLVSAQDFNSETTFLVAGSEVNNYFKIVKRTAHGVDSFPS